jgi:hypothetical protein
VPGSSIVPKLRRIVQTSSRVERAEIEASKKITVLSRPWPNDRQSAVAAAKATAASPPNRSTTRRTKVLRTETCPRPRGIGIEYREPVKKARSKSNNNGAPILETGVRERVNATAPAPAMPTSRMNHVGARYLYIGVVKLNGLGDLGDCAKQGAKRRTHARFAVSGPRNDSLGLPQK